MGGGQGTIPADGVLGTRQKAERRDPLGPRATAERGLGTDPELSRLLARFADLNEGGGIG